MRIEKSVWTCKILSMLLTLCLVFGIFTIIPITAHAAANFVSLKVNDIGYDATVNQNGAGVSGTWAWVANTNTLTLTDYVGGPIDFLGVDPGTATVVIEGTVHITARLNSYGALVLKGTSSDTLNVSSDIPNGCGISGKEGITVEEITLNVSTTGEYNSCLLSTNGSFHMASGKLNLSTTGLISAGILSNGDVVISGTAQVQTNPIVTDLALRAFNEISISGNAVVDVKSTGYVAISSAIITVSGGTVTAKGIGSFGAIYSVKDFNVTGGNVTVGGIGENNGDIYGNLSVGGATTHVTVNGRIKGGGSLFVSDGTVILTGTVDGMTSHKGGTLNGILPTHIIFFDLNGGTHTGGGALSQNVTAGSAAIEPTVTKDDHTFIGWDKEFSNVQGSIIVTALWQATQSPSAIATAPLNLDLNGTRTGSVSISLGQSGSGTMADYAEVEVEQNGVAEVSQGKLTSHDTITVTAKTVGNATVTVRFYDANGEMTAHTASIPVTVTNSASSGSASGSSSSGSSGGNQADTAPNLPNGSGTIAMVGSAKPITKQESEKALTDSIAKLPAGSKDVTLTLKNPGTISPEVLKNLEQKSAEKGLTLKLNFDTVSGGKITGRITLKGGSSVAAGFTPGFNQTRADKITAIFRKHFSNNLFAVCMNQQGDLGRTVSVAVLLPEGIKADNFVVYSYDSKTGVYKKLDAKVRIDKNGYVHFDTTIGGDFVISNGELVKK